MKGKTVPRLMVLTLLLVTITLGVVGCGQVLPTSQEQAKPVQPTSTKETAVTGQTTTPSQAETNKKQSNDISTIKPDNLEQPTTSKANSTTKSSEKPQSTSQQTATPKTNYNQLNANLITKTEFNQLAYGDTYEHIGSVIGKPTSIVSEEGIKGSKDYTITYLYKGNGGIGSQAILVFKADKLLHKVGLDLK